MTLRILVSGMIAGVPRNGGATWAVLQYVLGLRRLGHDVLFVEPVEKRAAGPSAIAAYFEHVVRTFGLEDCAALLVDGTHRTLGPPYAQLAHRAATCDVLLNVGGMLTDPSLRDPAPVRVYLDLDPAFTQLWQESEGIDMRLRGHNRFVTVGTMVGRPGCTVPTCGLDWIPTLPPVVLDQWPVSASSPERGFTTVANWRGYGSIQRGGVLYGQKAHSFRPLMDLPARTGERFEIALAIDPAESRDLDKLRAGGWRLLDPDDVAGTTGAYRRFVSASKGELGVAKSGYVLSRSGWFSDRSACYLACGRPVVAQDTGFGGWLPTGEGLLPFTTADDAAEAIKAVNADYERHRDAARTVAREHLDSDRVLARLLERVG